jgi:hypothetical protein
VLIDCIGSGGGTLAGSRLGEQVEVDGMGRSRTASPDVGFSTSGVGGYVMGDGDESVSSMVLELDFFPFQGWGIVNDMGEIRATSNATNTLLGEYQHGTLSEWRRKRGARCFGIRLCL